MTNPDLYGIFCLEGEWAHDDLTTRDSVQPLLDLLERLGYANTIHRDVATVDELRYYLSRWSEEEYDDFFVLYFACHGSGGVLDLGRDQISLDDLQVELAGKCATKIIYFGSCGVMNQPEERLKEFARVTKAKAVVGYEKNIDWLESAAFELLVLERLVRDNRSDAFFNHLVRDHGKFAADLGLVAATRSKVYRSAAVDAGDVSRPPS